MLRRQPGEATIEVITIQLATVHDAEKIRACLEAAFAGHRAHYTRPAFEDTVPTVAAIRARMTYMTVYKAWTTGGEIIGTVACGVVGEIGHLRGMAVYPAWQGQGIAEQLLHAAESALITAGCVHVTLDTTEPLRRAIRFYEKHGYSPSGRVTDFFGMPLYEYVKTLR